MLGWLFRKPKYYRYPDTLGFQQNYVDAAIENAVNTRLKEGDVVFLVCHFPQTFEYQERQLNEANLDFEIPTGLINSEDVNQMPKGRLFLTLSQMFGVSDQTVAQETESTRQLSIIVTERNPVRQWDLHIEKFAKNAKSPAKVGYYLSFEQPLMDHCFGAHERNLLKNWSAVGSHVFSSAIASRRVDAKIRSQFGPIENPIPADSIEQWLQLNLPKNEDS